MKYTLKKLSDNVNALRTAEVVGYAPQPPKVGQRFVIYTDSLTEPEFGIRYVATSPVTSISDDGGTFRTVNSEYRVEAAAE